MGQRPRGRRHVIYLCIYYIIKLGKNLCTLILSIVRFDIHDVPANLQCPNSSPSIPSRRHRILRERDLTALQRYRTWKPYRSLPLQRVVISLSNCRQSRALLFFGVVHDPRQPTAACFFNTPSSSSNCRQLYHPHLQCDIGTELHLYFLQTAKNLFG